MSTQPHALNDECQNITPQVEFCSWCPDPHHPSPAHHPGGQPAHQPEDAR